MEKLLRLVDQTTSWRRSVSPEINRMSLNGKPKEQDKPRNCNSYACHLNTYTSSGVPLWRDGVKKNEKYRTIHPTFTTAITQERNMFLTLAVGGGKQSSLSSVSLSESTSSVFICFLQRALLIFIYCFVTSWQRRKEISASVENTSDGNKVLGTGFVVTRDLPADG